MKRKKGKGELSELNKRYSLISVISVLLCIMIFSVFQAVLMDDIFLLKTKINMISVSEEIGSLDFESDKLHKRLSDIEANNNIYLEIYSPRDTLIYTTQSNTSLFDAAGESDKEMHPRIMKILSRTERADNSYFELRQEYYATAEYVVYGCFFGEDMALEMFYSADVIRKNADTASNVLFGMSMFVMTLIIILAIYIGTMVFVPLRTIIRNTRRMANMDFSAKCPEYKINDLNVLSSSINALSSSLSDAMDKLKNENRQLETDILYERRQEKIRRSFISNVSHELKTPISIIQGYAEGMKIGIGCDSVEEFCDIIIDESEKMNNLIVRLMEYMKLNTGAYNIYSSAFNLKELICECAEVLKLKFSEKGVEFRCEVDESFMAYSDSIMVETILNNYLSNALSHADYQKLICVSAEDVGGSYRVSVFNTGKQIPGTDIENIWQSFYRADKSHSRAEGRFGLGLSFVSSIQELMGEKFGVENMVDGVRFWFDVKKNIQ